jgi:16S rRNA (adenine1518-N6/adenine1519-N6)-dimethyltransferase
MAKHRARKRFGQHFLSDPGIIDAIVRAVHPTADDVIVEIGPGQGAITDALARSAGHLHAVELDRDLVARLRRRYEDNPNVTVHEADALQFDFASLGDRIRVVGNLPYNISTPLLFHLLKFRSRILDMHFMLQKEVVDRMAASPGRQQGLWSVGYHAWMPPEHRIVIRCAAGSIRPTSRGHFGYRAPGPAAAWSTLVSTAFMQRRKTLRNSLKKSVEAIDFEAVGIDASQRPEQISIGDYVRLSNHLRQKSR